jgi:hypothetical protein
VFIFPLLMLLPLRMSLPLQMCHLLRLTHLALRILCRSSFSNVVIVLLVGIRIFILR